MKIENYIKGSVVVFIFFTLGLVLMGNGLLKQWQIEDAPEFAQVDEYGEDIDSIQTNLEEETLERDDEPGQMDRDEDTTDVSWYTYTRRSLKAVHFTVTAADGSKGGITQVLNYLYVNPMIIGGIITILIMSFVFGLVAWWKGRRV